MLVSVLTMKWIPIKQLIHMN